MTNSELCINFAKAYLSASSDREVSDWDVYPTIYEDSEIPWFLVGRNSDSYFYLGVDKDGNLWRRASSCNQEITIPHDEYLRLLSSDNQEDRDKAYASERWVSDVTMRQVTQDTIGYIGHF